MKKAAMCLFAGVLALALCSAAMASHVCAYVNDNIDTGLSGPNNEVEGYMVGPGTATVHVGPFATHGSGLASGFFSGGLLAVRVKGNDLYVDDANTSPNGFTDISHFKINPTNCTLTLDAMIYPSGDTSLESGDSLVITPNGKFLYVAATGDSHIYVHKINSAGALSAATSVAATPGVPAGAAVSSDGKTLVVAFSNTGTVCAYPVAANGSLGTPNCQSPTGSLTGVAIDPANACVYVSVSTTGNAEVFALTLSAGVLGTPHNYFLGSGLNSGGVLVNFNNRLLYVGNPYSAQITAAKISAGCALTYATISSDGVAGVDEPGQIAQSAQVSNYVVAGEFDGSFTPNMGIFKAAASGALIPISGSGQFPLVSAFFVAPISVVAVPEKAP